MNAAFEGALQRIEEEMNKLRESFEAAREPEQITGADPVIIPHFGLFPRHDGTD
jgi:imidazoleglycerol phosphate synthase glutamine amidotransferase subunit HisH